MRPMRPEAGMNARMVGNERAANSHGVALAGPALLLGIGRSASRHEARNDSRGGKRAFHVYPHLSQLPLRLKKNRRNVRRVHLARIQA